MASRWDTADLRNSRRRCRGELWGQEPRGGRGGGQSHVPAVIVQLQGGKRSVGQTVAAAMAACEQQVVAVQQWPVTCCCCLPP